MSDSVSDVNELLKENLTQPDFVIDGIHFGRGDSYSDETTQLKHTTTQVKCWRIVNESLENVEERFINEFYSCETYIIQWKSVTDSFRTGTDEILNKWENVIYFYWKGEDATKGYSPLPTEIEKDNPPVERIVQWAEPPPFLQLFRGTFVVHLGKHKTSSALPHLYILRGEIQQETHLYEVPLKKESLRSRTSFVLYLSKEKKAVVWHGSKSNERSRSLAEKAAEKVFGENITLVEEEEKSEIFLQWFKDDATEYFAVPVSKIVDYMPRLFYFSKITGSFLAAEVISSHKSSYLSPFPFLQSHLYTADQPAIFLLDDSDEIWIWYGWHRDEDDDFKSECFVTAINYAKQKSKTIKNLVKVHKVVAGFEPLPFTNLFPVWKKREDIAKIQEKDGMLPNLNALIEVISHEEAPNVLS